MELRHWPVTYWLLVIIIGIFVVQFVAEAALPRVGVQTPIGAFGVNQVDWNFALWPGRMLQGDVLWGVLTSIFLHADLFHLFFNCWALYLFGLFLESKIGKKNLLKVFFAAGLIGSVAHLAFSVLAPQFGLYTYALGASGAIFGILGALVVLEPNLKVIMMPVPFPLPLWQAVGVFVVFMSLLFGFGGLGGIAHDVHMAGLAVGLVMGFYFKGKISADSDYTWRTVYEPKKDKYDWIDEYR